jgi:integrase
MLTEMALKSAKPKEKAYRLWDERGLYIEVTPSGGKLWRFKYRFADKEKRLALGKYPEVTLKEARDRREAARKLLANEIDPSAYKKEAQAQLDLQSRNTFEAVAREWVEKQRPNWADNHTTTVVTRLEKNVFPWLGKQAIADITAPEVLAVLRKIEGRGAIETAQRVKGICSQVFRYAIATSRAERDPCADLRGALASAKPQHLAATTDPKRLGQILNLIDTYYGSIAVRCALKLAPVVFVRPGELRAMKWAEVDFEAKEWRYFVTKTHQQHIVPLSRQAIAILEEMKPVTGGGELVFEGERPGRQLSNNTLNAALRSISISQTEQTIHGFRATARTMLDEVLGFKIELIEHQLAHHVKDPLGRAYNRTKHLEQRRDMMQRWADYLDELRDAAQKG